MTPRAGLLARAALALCMAGCAASSNEGSGGATTGGVGGTGAAPYGGTGGGLTGGTGGATGGTGGLTGGTGGLTGGTGGLTGGTGGGPTGVGPCVPGTTYEQPNLAAAVPTPVYTGSGSGLFEGVVWVSQVGALFFSDMTFAGDVPPSDIHRLTPPSTVAPFVSGSGSNGLAVNAAGQIVACTHDTQSLSLFDPTTGTRTPWVATNHEGQTFNSPNDLTIHPNGTVYFTDPDWQLGSRPNASGITGVYGVTPAGAVFLVDGSLDKPNGIALSPDGTVLYVSDYSGRIGAYPVGADGATGARTEFASGIAVPDGMTVDCGGNVYAAQHEAGVIHVLAPNATPLGQITVAPSLTNVGFGGADGKTLYATAAKTLYAIPMNVPGHPY